VIEFVLVGLQSQKGDIDLPLYDFSTIAVATGHFSQTNMIGAGGFGSVYKVMRYGFASLQNTISLFN